MKSSVMDVILTVGSSGIMAYSSILTSKGQITVPQQVRTRLGLKQGDRVEFVIEGDRTVIRPTRSAPNPFRTYAGALGTFPKGIHEINAWVDELRDGRRSRS